MNPFARFREVRAARHALWLLSGHVVSAAIFSAMELGVFEALRDGARPPEALAHDCGVDPRLFRRLLAALVSLGLVTRDRAGAVRVTPVGAALQEGRSGSVAAMARYLGRPVQQRQYLELAASLRAGRPAFELAAGASFYAYGAAHPEELVAMDRAMTAVTEMTLPAVLGAYDFRKARTVVDVAGGEGHLLAGILGRCPETRGILFDRPETVTRAKAHLADAGLADRCELVGGDFFAAVPPGGDLYILAKTLNDWDDGDALRILRACHAAMPPGAKLIVIEMLMADGGRPAWDVVARDLFFLAMALDARIRTEKELRTLFTEAGLTSVRRIRTRSPFWIVEGVKA